ncbi:SdiA-regulated domain-containing protein [Methylophaga sp.]|uniref:SdiA-regulated domain-containing protein n=1 Tax=Methylophaga sp. TaxID=2024840 RepID=UPI003F6A10B1
MRQKSGQLQYLSVALGFLLLGLIIINKPFTPDAQAHVSEWDLNYHYDIGQPVTLKTIKDNLSGLTYHPESDHLYAVLNNPEEMIELSKQGEVIRRITLDGFSDTESIDYLGNGLFVVSEERRHRLVFFYIDSDTVSIDYAETQHVPLDWANDNNKGLEGVTWSARYGFFVAHEQPPKVMHHTMHDAEPQFDASRLNNELPFDVSDYAGISMLHDGDEEYLLVLSEESQSLHALNLQGIAVSSLSLKAGLLNLWPIMKQPEGVAVDNDGNIYIVGEPNQMLTLKRKTRLAQLTGKPHS